MPGVTRRVRKYYLKRNGERGGSTAQMDDANRGICYALRHPPDGSKPTKLEDIQKIVRKTNGHKPKLSAISLAASTFKDKKGVRGRPLGARDTSKAEDKKLMRTFHRMRPPGYGVNSRIVHTALPRNIQAKIGRRTVIRSSGLANLQDLLRMHSSLPLPSPPLHIKSGSSLKPPGFPYQGLPEFIFSILLPHWLTTGAWQRRVTNQSRR